MTKSMKPPALKTVSVRCSDFWSDEFEIDPSIYDDVLMEAATRAVEKRKDDPEFKVTIMIECWEKKDEQDLTKHICYNTYFILVNAGLHKKAEILRLNFFKLNKIDIQKESLKPNESNGGSKSKPSLN